MSIYKTLLGAGALSMASMGMAQATSVDFTFNNMSGFLATPVYTAVHRGAFDAFDNGGVASIGLEQVAELPIPPQAVNLLAPTRIAVDPNSEAGFIFGPGGPIQDGESGTLTLEVDDPLSNRYATFLAMFVPSNDTFLGNDNPFAYEIFDASGSLIEQTFEITAQSIYDAGTEINQLFGAAAPGQDITLGDTENGRIQRLLDIDDGNGGDGFDALEALFGVAGAGLIQPDTVLFTVDVRESAAIAPVPLPAGMVLLLSGVAGMGLLRRKRKVATEA